MSLTSGGSSRNRGKVSPDSSMQTRGAFSLNFCIAEMLETAFSTALTTFNRSALELSMITDADAEVECDGTADIARSSVR